MNCFNGEKYLEEAITSVLNQTFIDWELIFFDNMSTDQSAKIFKSFDDPRLVYVFADAHRDLGGSRAAAFRHLRGEFIAVLDTDDLWLPEKLEEQLPYFMEAEVGIVICNTIFFNEKYEKILYQSGPPPIGWVTNDLLNRYFVSLETLIMRRSFINELSIAFDPDFSFIADFDLVIRLSNICKMEYCPMILAKWRVHSDSCTWKSSHVFSDEKERWAKKQMESGIMLTSSSKMVFEHFLYRVYCHQAVFLLLAGDRHEAFKRICKSKMTTLLSWTLLLLIISPFGPSFISLALRFKRRLSWG